MQDGLCKGLVNLVTKRSYLYVKSFYYISFHVIPSRYLLNSAAAVEMIDEKIEATELLLLEYPKEKVMIQCI